MTIFTDLQAAIEEAKFMKNEVKRHHCVVQKKGGIMRVREVTSMKKENGLKKMYSTASGGVVNVCDGYFP